MTFGKFLLGAAALAILANVALSEKSSDGGAVSLASTSLQPEAQKSVVAAVEQARQIYRSATNDLQKGSARATRSKAICAALSSFTASGWVGRVATLSSNSDGKGVLGIEIGPKIYVTTWNNEVSDFQDKTLLDPGSGVFRTASTLKQGQLVMFSGDFRPASPDCIRESSVTLDGSIRSPEFIMRFKQLGPAGTS